jgi:hypothetical protein
VLILAHSSDNTAMALPLGVTGVIIPVLAAEPLLDRPGVPPRVVEAHVTVLFPWVPMDQMTDEDEQALAAIFADRRPGGGVSPVSDGPVSEARTGGTVP